MFFGRKKKSNYRINLNDYEVVVFVNFITSQLCEIKSCIEETEDPILLGKLINERNALIKITIQLGFEIYKEELKQFKNTSEEVQAILIMRSNEQMDFEEDGFEEAEEEESAKEEIAVL